MAVNVNVMLEDIGIFHLGVDDKLMCIGLSADNNRIVGFVHRNTGMKTHFVGDSNLPSFSIDPP